MSVTLLIVASNQEYLLKQNLSGYLTQLKAVGGTCIVIDDSSIDQTQSYIETHFPDVEYKRNNYEMGYEASINAILPFISTPYLMCIDLHVDMISLRLDDVCTTLSNTGFFMMYMPVDHKDNPLTLSTLTYKGFHLKINTHSLATSSTPPPPSCVFSEAMILNVKQLLSLQGLTPYETIGFSWMDLLFRAQQQGYRIGCYNQGLIKKTTCESYCFSYKPLSAIAIKDSLVFQVRHFSSLRYRIKRWLWIITISLTFRPKYLFATINALLSTFFNSQKRKRNWYIYSDKDILQTKKA